MAVVWTFSSSPESSSESEELSELLEEEPLLDSEVPDLEKTHFKINIQLTVSIWLIIGNHTFILYLKPSW